MKKKLLITLGCSWTEGYGCYDENTIPIEARESKSIDGFDIHPIQDANKNRFHELGWPNALGKRLGYDKVINMGYGGSSTSGQLKRFYESYYNNPFNDYDVTIIWMLTHPTRFSFYNDYKVEDVMPGMPNLGNMSHLPDDYIGQHYLKFIGDWQIDPTLEQLFHIRSMEQYCQNYNFNLLMTHTDIKTDALLKYYHDSKYWMDPIPDNILFFLDYDTDYSFVCGHPNEVGYLKLVDKLYELIKNNHSHLLNRTAVDEIEWEWTGGIRMSWINPNEDMMDGLIGADYIHQRLRKKKKTLL